MHPSIVALLPKLKHQAASARHFFQVRFRGGLPWSDAQGGYVHDTNVSQFIFPGMSLVANAVWTDTAGAVGGTYMRRITAAAATQQLVIPVNIPQNAIALKGAYLKSFDMWYIIGTASLTTLAAVIRHNTVPANAAAYTNVNETFGYDSVNTTAGNRITAAQHLMTVTPSTPWWLLNTDQVSVELTIVNPGTSVFDFYGARANYTLRM